MARTRPRRHEERHDPGHHRGRGRAAHRDHTVTLTTAQAVVRYLAAQTSVRDGRRQRLIPAMLGIFGHGNVAGIGQALDEYQTSCPSSRAATSSRSCTSRPAYAKASRRSAALAVTASIGPGRGEHGSPAPRWRR
jgi:TPP-dependent trihydroxycyclohexane-1,2-dione (THcHDO) dehydratase